ncbi:Putative fungal transcription factor [Septoria linicola]|uniref:Fungal transcription factor n=1 Tax=Septoria linicola TaxID=215465 RepID=A0A9Q9B2N8_9PEZI|nr:putative fungal transcription factor [Septoria linicola]USW55241.1 Putative fungal transcription factor [Septoria linicola]
MAGCEAITLERREKLMSWIQRGASTTGFHCYEKAKEVLLAVWERRDASQYDEGSHASSKRDRPSSLSCSWLQVCRDQRAWLMAF